MMSVSLRQVHQVQIFMSIFLLKVSQVLIALKILDGFEDIAFLHAK